MFDNIESRDCGKEIVAPAPASPQPHPGYCFSPGYCARQLGGWSSKLLPLRFVRSPTPHFLVPLLPALPVTCQVPFTQLSTQLLAVPGRIMRSTFTTEMNLGAHSFSPIWCSTCKCSSLCLHSFVQHRAFQVPVFQAASLHLWVSLPGFLLFSVNSLCLYFSV